MVIHNHNTVHKPQGIKIDKSIEFIKPYKLSGKHVNVNNNMTVKVKRNRREKNQIKSRLGTIPHHHPMMALNTGRQEVYSVVGATIEKALSLVATCLPSWTLKQGLR